MKGSSARNFPNGQFFGWNFFVVGKSLVDCRHPEGETSLFGKNKNLETGSGR